MVKYIKAGSESFPVNFGMKALADFCDATKRTMNDLVSLGDTLTPNDAIVLTHCALKDGARREKISFALTLDDVVNLMDDNTTFFTDVMGAFADSQAVEDTEKKTISTKSKSLKK